jgi:hypothetical protein
MRLTDLQPIAQAVLDRAQQNGFVVPRDIRAALAAGKLKESRWKEVLELLGPSLDLRDGRYHFVSRGLSRMRERAHQDQRHQQAIRRCVSRLIRICQRVEVPVERRGQSRMELIRPVQVLTEDGRTLHVLTRDLSASGIRLLGAQPLHGQRVRVWIPPPGKGRQAYCFLVRMLWSALVADDLYESGGVFLELLEDAPG